METRSKGQSHLKIIELTADQEVPESAGGRIIDLTKTLDGSRPLSPPQPSPMEPPAFPDATADAKTKEAWVLKHARIDADIDKAFEDVEPVEGLTDPAEAPAEQNEFPEPSAPERKVPPSDSEEIIDLEEMVLPETLQGPAPSDPTQEIIDLTEIIRPGAPQYAAAPDEIIDLVDVVTPPPTADGSQDEIIDLVDVVRLGNRREEIIDLVDIVLPAEMARTHDSKASAHPEPCMKKNNLLSLDRLLPDEEDRLPENEQTGQPAEHRRADTPEADITLGLGESLAAESDDHTGIPMEAVGIEPDKAQLQASVVSQGALEAAIEKILLTRYGDRIERLIAIAVEKAVNREIEQIKGEFMDEVDLQGDEDEDPD